MVVSFNPALTSNNAITFGKSKKSAQLAKTSSQIGTDVVELSTHNKAPKNGLFYGLKKAFGIGLVAATPLFFTNCDPTNGIDDVKPVITDTTSVVTDTTKVITDTVTPPASNSVIFTEEFKNLSDNEKAISMLEFIGAYGDETNKSASLKSANTGYTTTHTLADLNGIAFHKQGGDGGIYYPIFNEVGADGKVTGTYNITDPTGVKTCNTYGFSLSKNSTGDRLVMRDSVVGSNTINIIEYTPDATTGTINKHLLKDSTLSERMGKAANDLIPVKLLENGIPVSFEILPTKIIRTGMKSL